MKNKTLNATAKTANAEKPKNQSKLIRRNNQKMINYGDDGFIDDKQKHEKSTNVISFQKYPETSQYKRISKARIVINNSITKKFVTTVMFTDIVKSTQLVLEVGDFQWMKLLQSHHALIRKNLENYSGIELQIIGDGFFMCFHSTEKAIECARNIHNDMKKVNLPIRIGIHTGEVLLQNDLTLSGLTIHIASRVTAVACADQIVVSQTVKDVVTGSKIDFKNLGFYKLKGLPNAWNLFSPVEVEH